MSGRVKCKKCSNMILPETASLYSGKCAMCAKPKPKPNLPRKINSLSKFLTEVEFKKYDPLSIDERLSELTATLAEMHEHIHQMPAHLRAVYITETIEQHAGNGGLAQAFANVPSLFDYAVADYLKLGLVNSADIMRGIMSLLPSEVALKRELGLEDSFDIEVFRKYLAASRLQTLDNVFYDEFGVNNEARLNYVISNRDIFIQL